MSSYKLIFVLNTIQKFQLREFEKCWSQWKDFFVTVKRSEICHKHFLFILIYNPRSIYFWFLNECMNESSRERQWLIYFKN